jgi:hypothetical protein
MNEEQLRHLQKIWDEMKTTTPTVTDRNVVVTSLQLSSMMTDRLIEKAAELRTCPGKYWREEGAECTTKMPRKFDKRYRGPPPESAALCNSCGQTYQREKKKQKKKKNGGAL